MANRPNLSNCETADLVWDEESSDLIVALRTYYEVEDDFDGVLSAGGHGQFSETGIAVKRVSIIGAMLGNIFLDHNQLQIAFPHTFSEHEDGLSEKLTGQAA